MVDASMRRPLRRPRTDGHFGGEGGGGAVRESHHMGGRRRRRPGLPIGGAAAWVDRPLALFRLIPRRGGGKTGRAAAAAEPAAAAAGSRSRQRLDIAAFVSFWFSLSLSLSSPFPRLPPIAIAHISAPLPYSSKF